jgi:hypothetical protein
MQETNNPKYITVRRLLTWAEYADHFNGEETGVTVAIYPITDQEYVQFLCFDVDTASRDIVKDLWHVLAELSLGDSTMVEFSGNGHHLYVPFSEPVLAEQVVQLGRVVLHKLFPEAENLYKLNSLARAAKIELFPKQTKTAHGGVLGSAIRIPLGWHRPKKKWSRLLDPYNDMHMVRRDNEDDMDVIPCTPEYLDLTVKSFEKELEALKVSPLATVNGSSNAVADMRPCFEDVIMEGVPEGERAHCAFYLASYLHFAKKYDYYEVLEALSKWNEKNSPTLETEKLAEAANRGRMYCPPACQNAGLYDYCQRVGECRFKSKHANKSAS